MPAAIDISQLGKRFGRQWAVRDLSFRVERGSVFGLIGPNGAGKTTTLRMLLDIVRPSVGSAQVLGETPRRGGPQLRRRIGYVPGELRLDGHVRGRQLLGHLAELSGPVDVGAIDELAERLGADLARPVRALSKGNKQKLGLIQAFMHQPDLLILDEPTSGLDPLVQREFLDLVREARDRGQSVLLSSHVLSEIQQVADEVAVISDGHVVADGAVGALRLGRIRHVQAGIAGGVASEIRSAVDAIPGVRDLQILGQSPVRLRATIDGDIDPLVKVLAHYEVTDLVVEEPDLEESVLRLYGGGRHA